MKTPREVEIQEQIINVLSKNYNISPFSVICTFALNTNGLVSITFWIKQDLYELLNLLDYKCQCDKSGYIILEENNTIILTGMALINLYTKL